MGNSVTSDLSAYLSAYREKQIRLIREQCTNPDVDTAVHEIRKSFKRLRTLELVLKPLDESLAMKRGDQWKMLGERLAAPRDSAIMRYGISQMMTEKEQTYLAEVRRMLDEEYEKAIRDLTENKILDGIQTYIEKNSLLLHPVLSDELILEDLSIAGRDLFTDMLSKGKRAKRKEKSRFMHSWRKSLKHLQYLLDIFHDSGTEALREQERYIKSITEQLGLYNDYSVLQRWLKSHKKMINPDSYRGINKRLKKRKRTLAKGAFEKGEKLLRVDAAAWWDFFTANAAPID